MNNVTETIDKMIKAIPESMQSSVGGNTSCYY